MTDKKYYYIILIGLCFLIYANSIHNDFISDDLTSIVEFPFIAQTGRFLFEPTELLNSLCYRIGKLNVVPYHLLSIALHALNTILVFLFLRLFFKADAGFFGAVLFAIHPVHVEAVTWISGRNYLILTFFVLTTYLLYYSATDPSGANKEQKRRNYLLAILIFLYFIYKNCSYFAFMPLLFVFSDIVFKRWRTSWKLWIPFFIMVLGALVLMKMEISDRIARATLDIGTDEITRNPVEYFVFSTFKNFVLFVWPATLSLYHEPAFFHSGWIVVGAIVLSAGAWFLPRLYRASRPLSLGLGIFVLFLLPTYSPWPVASVVAERYLYIPSLVLSIFVAEAYQWLSRRGLLKKKGLAIAIMFIFAAFALRSVARNEDWKDNETFWRATLRTHPDSPRAHNNMGVVYLRSGNVEKAIEEFNIAKQINPSYVDAYNNLGILYRYIGEEQAIKLLERATELNPYRADIYYNLGNLYRDIWHIEKAIEYFNKAIAVNPRYAKADNNLGNLYLIKRDHRRAFFHYQRALASNPRYGEAAYNLGNWYAKSGQFDKAVEMFESAMRNEYVSSQLYSNLGFAYAQQGRPKRAITMFENAIELDGSNVKAYNNLASVYLKRGEARLAIPFLKQAIAIDARYGATHFNLAVAYMQQEEFEKAAEECDKALALGFSVPKGFLEQIEPYRIKGGKS